MYYVYMLINPISKRSFYIGKGSNDRLQSHLNGLSDINKAAKEEYVQIQKEGFEVKGVIIKDEILNEDEAYDLEKRLIKKYGRRRYDSNGWLTNIMIGGNHPPTGKGLTYEERFGERAELIKKKIGKSRKRTHKLNGPFRHTEETKRKISKKISGKNNGFYNKKHTDEAKQLMSLNSKGKTAGSKNGNAKHYRLISPDNEEFTIYGGLYKFLKERNLPIATMEKALKTSKMPMYGKCAGWKIERVEEEASDGSNK